ncbi:polysaccharide pyruvyl transferase family protein [Rhodococcus sp. IEGM 1401]|uniref:polysaccharide pyruvyl transferase family protein n=1 Tax=unclassified Rhodococcus (in: high G+C Gram-positive bacteria) TaxID=192944 RepID=UPI0022B39032|nr:MULTISPECIES: polysaccharide pyruvyl transferase family protein [unclassified Rhodococcus (in: high G+C Gram-positive bacteria)]MCZ4560901.1 polysaccharide pyruvyl transferase family protein [Rhodococcus sp. IEGM 1401]MDI9921042.1 polysaccharide pyruvyl transferase family protein [Rhodococcus sp. IEGM 1372]MDV8033358.1 polysaccharide pyruvyl transferase family protein [Rhodococcus sp. IEGM 1414]
MRGKGVRSVLVNLVRTAFNSRAFALVLLLIDGLCVRVYVLFASTKARQYELLLVAPPGAGNIGDQALVESALDNSVGSVLLVVRNSCDFVIPSAHLGRVRVAEFRHLIYGRSLKRFTDLFRFFNYAKRSESTWLIGADIMDGAYNPLASVSRFSCVISAAKLGSKASVLGFSWNSHGTASATYCARIAAESVRLIARDSFSRRRLLESDVSPVSNGADIVFSRMQRVQESPYSEWVAMERAKGKKVAVVNASALLAGKYDQRTEYQNFISQMDPKVWSIIFVPHVRRAGNDDLLCLADLAVSTGGLECKVIEELLSPSEIFSILMGSTFVLTGRMHLAVLAINAGVYPVTMSSQGKVSGLYDMLSCPELCIEPSAGCSGQIATVFQALSANDFPNVPHSIREEIASLSRANFVPFSS